MRDRVITGGIGLQRAALFTQMLLFLTCLPQRPEAECSEQERGMSILPNLSL